MGSLLKGVFGIMVDSRQQKYELEMAREARNNEFAVEFQASLNSGDGGMFTRATRRMLAFMGMGAITFVTCLTAIYPSVPILSTTNITGEGRTELLFGLISFPAEQTNMVITTGHLCLFECSVVLPMIVGFYFTPGGRR